MNNQLEIKPFNASYFDLFVEMALENYLLERNTTNALRNHADKDYFNRHLEKLFSKGAGRIAFDENKLVGFLAFDGIFPINNTGAKGATSPLYGYGIRHTKRGEIIGKLFQDLAATLCENFAQSLRVSVYAHDMEVLWTYIMSGFSMDVTDVVRDVNSPIDTGATGQYSFREVGKKELINYKQEIIELYRSLINHLRMSPVFYHCRYFLPIENRFEDFLSDAIRVFAAFDGNKLVGMIDSEQPDNGFCHKRHGSKEHGGCFCQISLSRKWNCCCFVKIRQ